MARPRRLSAGRRRLWALGLACLLGGACAHPGAPARAREGAPPPAAVPWPGGPEWPSPPLGRRLAAQAAGLPGAGAGVGVGAPEGWAVGVWQRAVIAADPRWAGVPPPPPPRVGDSLGQLRVGLLGAMVAVGRHRVGVEVIAAAQLREPSQRRLLAALGALSDAPGTLVGILASLPGQRPMPVVGLADGGRRLVLVGPGPTPGAPGTYLAQPLARLWQDWGPGGPLAAADAGLLVVRAL